MSPFDGIRPPKKNKKKEQKIRAKTEIQPKTEPEEKEPLIPEKQNESKHWLVWAMAIIITLVIFIIWVVFLQNGWLSSGGEGGEWHNISEKFSDLWETIKTDILKIRQSFETSNANLNEEEIKKLEEEIFPQFKNTNQQ